MNAPDPTVMSAHTSVNLTGGDQTAMMFGAVLLFVDLLFVLAAVVQARSQDNRYWLVWGLLTVAAPFLGYAAWRLFGAKDLEKPGDLLPSLEPRHEFSPALDRFVVCNPARPRLQVIGGGLPSVGAPLLRARAGR